MEMLADRRFPAVVRNFTQFWATFGITASERGTFGSLTWPSWSAEIGYSLPPVGRVIFGWQRSYYYEDLFRVTGYSANGFTVRFERSF